jgi:hypothetical protein
MINDKKYNYTYITTNLINNKRYVGDRSCNCDPEKDKYLGSGTALKLAMKKYNKENFQKEILEFFDTKQEAFEAQEKYIKKYKTHVSEGGYNIIWKGGKCPENITTREKISNSVKGENNGMYGKKHSEETKRKISKANKGKKSWMKGKHHTEKAKQQLRERFLGIEISDEHKENISKSLMGRKFSKEHRKKLSENSKGRIVSEETKEKISKSRKGVSPINKGKKMSEEQRKKLKDSWKKKKELGWSSPLKGSNLTSKNKSIRHD